MIIVTTNLYSQTYQSIEPIEERGEREFGVYYKDIQNVFDSFEGTYEYTGTDFYFKLKLEKKVISNNNNYFWEDLIKGTYQYNVNGVEVNHLNDPLALDDNPARVQLSSIRNSIPHYCPDCLDGKWLIGRVSDYVNNQTLTLFMAKKIVNGEEGLQLLIRSYGLVARNEDDPDPVPAFLPIGEFFVKKIGD